MLAGLHRALGGQLFAVVPTTDVAERTFTDLTYFLGEKEAQSVALLRPRDETVGAIESPSEAQRAHDVLADLCARKPRIVIAPVAALRQYVIPRGVFEALALTLEAGAEAGWDDLIVRLHRLGYARADVVSAAGEYAVRGGLLDVFAATADGRSGSNSSATRSNRFGPSTFNRSAATAVSTRSPSRRG